jgi:thymidylate synthase
MNYFSNFCAFSDVYECVLTRLLRKPDFVCTPRGLACSEVVSCELRVKPTSCFFGNDKRDNEKITRYLVGETLWYFGGRNDLEFIAEYASFWKGIANPDKTCNSAYGNLLFSLRDANGLTQWEWAYQSLVKDKDTRQAILHFNRPVHQHFTNKDFVCTLYANFIIRDNTLHLISRMRSQDVIKGLTYDVPFFSMLLENMYLLLLKTYPTLALGGLIHSSDSMHLYRNDEQLANDMLTCEFTEVSFYLPEPLVDENARPTEFYKQLFDNRTNVREVFETLRGAHV